MLKVGDPKQLPATVLSNVASKFLFECSMFERLQKAGHPVVMLTKQVSKIEKIISYKSCITVLQSDLPYPIQCSGVKKNTNDVFEKKKKKMPGGTGYHTRESKTHFC